MRRLLLLLLAGVLLVGCASDDPDPVREAAARIRVQGSGSVRATPDLLTVSLGVQTRATTAKSALADNNRRAQALLATLGQRGVAPEDRQTSQVSVQQGYDARGRVNGFVVDNVVTARLRDLDRAGELLDAVAAAAGDAVRINGLSFSIDDPAAAAGGARADAVRRARRQAEQLAKAAGVRLGRLHSIREAPPASSPYPANFGADRSAGASASVPLSPGDLEVRVDVELVYDVAD
ncbi:MAG: putative lipoprotein [Actinomycetia bacterium]|nr:putative lipoprotein [Actinomycetes bacterium]